MRESVFDLQLLRFRLTADLALARSAAEPGDPTEDERIGKLEGLRVEAERQLAEARAQGRGGRPEARLSSELGIGDVELDFIWAVVSRAMDPIVAGSLRELCGTDARRGLSVSHYASIRQLDDASARRLVAMLAPAHHARKFQVLIAAENGEVDVTMPLTVPARVATFLSGDAEPDSALAGLGSVVRVPELPEYDAAQQGSLARLSQGLSSAEPMVILLEGPIGAGRRTAAAWAARRSGALREVFAIDASRIAPNVEALEEALIALSRECRLRGAVPLIAEVDELPGSEGDQTRMRLLARTIEASSSVVIVTTSMPGLDLGVRQRRLLRVPWPVPGVRTRRALWDKALGAKDTQRLGSELDLISLRYRLGPGGIREGAESARVMAAPREGAQIESKDIVEGVRNNIAERLGDLATRVTVQQSWDDLVLAQDTMDEVKGLVARVRHAHQVYETWGFNRKMPRGIGVAALFSGPPGTGKTMVAGLLARELDLELYQVDLSKVVSKWVGETEKQLAKIFEAADAGHALLLFDEADSLFAKRTEVKSAIDRYANLEVNYLLQRIESFGGITILTTNLDTSIDPALRRRLASHIIFSAPEHQESVALWQRMMDTQAPVQKPLDFEGLASSYGDMSGANIRNAVLAAAFLAASEGSPITQKHLVRAAKGEYRAMGRVLG